MKKTIGLVLIAMLVFFSPQNASAKTVVCNYKSNDKEIEMRIDTEEKKAYFSIEGTPVNELDHYTKTDCPATNTLYYCPYLNKESDIDYTNDVVAYNQSCVEYAYDHSLHTEEYMKKYEVSKSSKTTATPDATTEVNPSASPNEGEESGDGNKEETPTWPGLGEDIGEASCDAILGDVVNEFQEIFNWFKILAPIFLILFSAIDFGKAVIVEEKENLKKSLGNCIKRAIAALAIFFLPFLINLLLNMPGISDRISDALCGIR